MASYLITAGTTLYRMTTAGVATEITLPVYPSQVTLFGTGTPLRSSLFTVNGDPIIVCVNGATQDFWIDTYGNTRNLQLAPPTNAPIPAAGAGTGLTGVYMVAATYKVKDINGATVMESALSPASSATAALANQSIALTSIPISANGMVNARGLYRTLSGGNVFYPWFDVDDNISLIEDRGVADARLSILPTLAQRNGAPPALKNVIVWLDRLWGVPRLQKDHLRWTDERLFYAWSADNEILAPPTNNDEYGITALIPRRDNLGVAKRKRFYEITGSSNDSFQRIGISETLGCVSQESVVVIQNVAYMLGEFSVNEWSDNGIQSISTEQVDAWFNSDDYFNRALFYKAQGRYNPDTDAYELLLVSAGSTILDKWISYHLKTRTWFGPHTTGAFVPTCTGNGTSFSGTLGDSSSNQITVFGGDDGYIYKRDESEVNDGDESLIQFDSSATLGYGTTLTWTHTCDASATILLVFTRSTPNLGGNISSVTYGSQEMTQIGSAVDVNASNRYTLFYLISPPSGEHQVMVNGATSLAGISASYIGASLDNPDNSTTNTGTGVTLSTSITPVENNCWIIYAVADFSGPGPGASTNCTLRANPGTPASISLFDSNSAVVGGVSYTMVATVSNPSGAIMVSLAPASPAPVVLSVDLPPLSANEPDFLKFYDRPTIHTREEDQGELVINPTVGTLEDPPGVPMSHDLTLGREVLDRLGVGWYCKLNLNHNSSTERPRIYGIEIPYFFITRR